jgi:choline dehydrogenase-like flavoprotein
MWHIQNILPVGGQTIIEADIPADIPADPALSSAYDYVVIGGGAAGCGLAAQLAKLGKTLLLERGKFMEEVPLTQHRSNWPQVMYPAVEWTRTEIGSWAASANVLGGGTSINAGVFLKETRESDFFKKHHFLDWEEIEKAYSDVSDKVR